VLFTPMCSTVPARCHGRKSRARRLVERDGERGDRSARRSARQRECDPRCEPATALDLHAEIGERSSAATPRSPAAEQNDCIELCSSVAAERLRARRCRSARRQGHSALIRTAAPAMSAALEAWLKVSSGATHMPSHRNTLVRSTGAREVDAKCTARRDDVSRRER